MEGQMGSYYLYVLNKQDKVSSRHEVEGDTDADAMIKAAAMMPLSEEFPNVEVWDGARIVGRVPRLNGG
jgi:hypothetical protein